MFFSAVFSLIIIFGSLYLAGLLVVVAYEFRMEMVYKAKNEALQHIQSLPKSMAVIHAKTFKVEQDYKQKTKILDKRQKRILKKLPYFRRAYI
jgi:archaellum component FlaF (FlaF/FlaG flagellin family)